MAKTRSPAYPVIGLKDAIEKVQAIYNKDYQNPIPRGVAAEHMGYNGLNGKSLGVLSALIKYGLLEGRGDNTRVTDLAVQIIAHPPGISERAEALRRAANQPELFQEIEARFPNSKASDQAIKSYLLTQKFIPAAAETALRAYRETNQLIATEAQGYNSGPEQGAEYMSYPLPDGPTPRGSPHPPLNPAHLWQSFAEAAPVASAPFNKVSLDDDTLTVSAKIVDQAGLKKLIAKLNALMVLLPEGELSN